MATAAAAGFFANYENHQQLLDNAWKIQGKISGKQMWEHIEQHMRLALAADDYVTGVDALREIDKLVKAPEDPIELTYESLDKPGWSKQRFKMPEPAAPFLATQPMWQVDSSTTAANDPAWQKIGTISLGYQGLGL